MELNKKTIRNIFLGVAGCIVLYWLLHETAKVSAVISSIGKMLSPFVVGAALAFVLNVPMRAIENCLRKIKKQGLRRGLSILLTIVAVVLVLFGVFYLLIPQVITTIESLIGVLPPFFSRVQELITTFFEERPDLLEFISRYTNLDQLDLSGLFQKAITLVTSGLGDFVNMLFSFVINLGTGVFNGVLSLVFALYCLARKEILARQGRRILYSILPEKACDETVRILRMTNSTFSAFISGQCLEAVILGTMFAITMPIFGMPYVPLISVIIAVTALIPIVGAFVGCFIGAFLILIVSPVQAFWFIVLFLVLQQIEGNLIYPRVVGRSVGLPGMWVLLAVAVGGDLMGVGGMLLMIPLASVCYALAREFTQKRLQSRNIDKAKLQDKPMDSLRKKNKKSKDTPKKTENE